MRRLVILLDLAVLRGPGREQELQRLGVAVARSWGVYFRAGTSWGYELYDSTSSVHLLRPTLRRTATSLKLPRVFQDSSASDLSGAELPSFLTLVDKATDPEFQERLQGSKAKLAQLQQPDTARCGVGEAPVVALASVLQAALSGSFLRKLKDVAEQSSGSGSAAEGLVLLFSPTVATAQALQAFLALETLPAAPLEATQVHQLVSGYLAPGLLQRCRECCTRLAWVPASAPGAAAAGGPSAAVAAAAGARQEAPPRSGGTGAGRRLTRSSSGGGGAPTTACLSQLEESGEALASKEQLLAGLRAAVTQDGTQGAVCELPVLAADELSWGAFSSCLGMGPQEQPEVGTGAAATPVAAAGVAPAGVASLQASPKQRQQQQGLELNDGVWPSGESSLEEVVDTLKMLLAHLEAGSRQGRDTQDEIRKAVRHRYRQQQKAAAAAAKAGPRTGGGLAAPCGRGGPAGMPRGKGQAVVRQAKLLQEREKENRRNASQPASAPGSVQGGGSQVEVLGEEEVESVRALPLEEAAEELARQASQLCQTGAAGLSEEAGELPTANYSPQNEPLKPAELSLRLKKLVDTAFIAVRKHRQREGQEPVSTDHVRSMLLSRAAAPAAALKLEYSLCRDPARQALYQRMFVVQVLLRLHICVAGMANGQPLPASQYPEIEGLLQLVNATLHPIPMAGHDFFNTIILTDFGAKFPGPLQRLSQELWEEEEELDFDALWEQAMAKDIDMEVSGETPGGQTQPSGGPTVSGNPQRSGSVRTNDTGSRPGPSNLGRPLPPAGMHRDPSLREMVTSTRPGRAGGASGSQSKFSGDHSGVGGAGGASTKQTGATSKHQWAGQNQLRMRALALGRNDSWQFAVQRKEHKPARAPPTARGGAHKKPGPQHLSSRGGAAQVAKAQAGVSRGNSQKAGHHKVPDTPESIFKGLPTLPSHLLPQQQQQQEHPDDLEAIFSPPPAARSPRVLPAGAPAAAAAVGVVEVPATAERPPLRGPPAPLAVALRRAASSRQLQFAGMLPGAAGAQASHFGVIPSSLPAEEQEGEPEEGGASASASPDKPAGPTWLVAATRQVKGVGGLRRAPSGINYAQLPPQFRMPGQQQAALPLSQQQAALPSYQQPTQQAQQQQMLQDFGSLSPGLGDALAAGAGLEAYLGSGDAASPTPNPGAAPGTGQRDLPEGRQLGVPVPSPFASCLPLMGGQIAAAAADAASPATGALGIPAEAAGAQGGVTAMDGIAEHASPEEPELSSGPQGTSPAAQQAAAAVAEPAAIAIAGFATAADGTTPDAVGTQSPAEAALARAPAPAPRRASLGGMPGKGAKIAYAQKPAHKRGSRKLKKRHGTVHGRGIGVACEVVMRFDDAEEAEIVRLDKGSRRIEESELKKPGDWVVLEGAPPTSKPQPTPAAEVAASSPGPACPGGPAEAAALPEPQQQGLQHANQQLQGRGRRGAQAGKEAGTDEGAAQQQQQGEHQQDGSLLGCSSTKLGQGANLQLVAASEPEAARPAKRQAMRKEGAAQLQQQPGTEELGTAATATTTRRSPRLAGDPEQAQHGGAATTPGMLGQSAGSGEAAGMGAAAAPLETTTRAAVVPATAGRRQTRATAKLAPEEQPGTASKESAEHRKDRPAVAAARTPATARNRKAGAEQAQQQQHVATGPVAQSCDATAEAQPASGGGGGEGKQVEHGSHAANQISSRRSLRTAEPAQPECGAANNDHQAPPASVPPVSTRQARQRQLLLQQQHEEQAAQQAPEQGKRGQGRSAKEGKKATGKKRPAQELQQEELPLCAEQSQDVVAAPEAEAQPLAKRPAMHRQRATTPKPTDAGASNAAPGTVGRRSNRLAGNLPEAQQGPAATPLVFAQAAGEAAGAATAAIGRLACTPVGAAPPTVSRRLTRSAAQHETEEQHDAPAAGPPAQLQVPGLPTTRTPAAARRRKAGAEQQRQQVASAAAEGILSPIQAGGGASQPAAGGAATAGEGQEGPVQYTSPPAFGTRSGKKSVPAGKSSQPKAATTHQQAAPSTVMSVGTRRARQQQQQQQQGGQDGVEKQEGTTSGGLVAAAEQPAKAGSGQRSGRATTSSVKHGLLQPPSVAPAEANALIQPVHSAAGSKHSGRTAGRGKPATGVQPAAKAAQAHDAPATVRRSSQRLQADMSASAPSLAADTSGAPGTSADEALARRQQQQQVSMEQPEKAQSTRPAGGKAAQAAAMAPPAVAPGTPLAALVQLGCSRCKDGPAGCSTCYASARESLAKHGLGFFLNLPCCEDKSRCASGQPDCSACWGRLLHILANPSWMARLDHCSNHTLPQPRCLPCRTAAGTSLAEEGVRLVGCSGCRFLANGCIKCWDKLNRAMAQLASHELLSADAPAAAAGPGQQGAALQPQQTPSSAAAIATVTDGGATGMAAKSNRKRGRQQTGTAKPAEPAASAEQAGQGSLVAAAKEEPQAGVCCQAAAEPAAADVEAGRLASVQPAEEPAREPAPEQQGPAKRHKKGKGRPAGSQQPEGEPAVAPPGSTCAAGHAERPAGEEQPTLREPGREGSARDAEMLAGEGAARKEPLTAQTVTAAAEAGHRADKQAQAQSVHASGSVGALHTEQQGLQEQQQGPVGVLQGQQGGCEGEQPVGHEGGAGEPAAKKAKLPSTSQVTGKAKTPRQRGLLGAMQAKVPRRDDGEVDQQPSRSHAATQSKHHRHTDTGAKSAARLQRSRSVGAAPAAAARPQYSSGAAQLARRQSMDAAAAQQASPYSDRYRMSPTASEGGSVGQEPSRPGGSEAAGVDKPAPASTHQQQRWGCKGEAQRGAAGPEDECVQDSTAVVEHAAMEVDPPGAGNGRPGTGQALQAQQPAGHASPAASLGLGLAALYASPDNSRGQQAGSEDVLSQFTSKRQGASLSSPGVADSAGQSVDGPHTAAAAAAAAACPDEVTSHAAVEMSRAVPAPAAAGGVTWGIAAAGPDELAVEDCCSPAIRKVQRLNTKALRGEAGVPGEIGAAAVAAAASTAALGSTSHVDAGTPLEPTPEPAAVAGGPSGAKTLASGGTAVALSALPQLSPLELLGTNPSTQTTAPGAAVPNESAVAAAAPGVRPMRRLTDGKAAARAAADVLHPSAGAQAAEATAGAESPAFIEQTRHAQPVPASVEHLQHTAQLNRRTSVDSGILLPMSAQQRAAAEREGPELGLDLELRPCQLFGEGAPRATGPHWQTRTTPLPRPQAVAAAPANLAAPAAAAGALMAAQAVQKNPAVAAGLGFSFQPLSQQQQHQQQAGMTGGGMGTSGLTALRGAYSCGSPDPLGLPGVHPRAAAMASSSPVPYGSQPPGLLLDEPATQEARALLESQPLQAALSPAALAQLQAGLPASQQEQCASLLSPQSLAAAAGAVGVRSPLRYRTAVNLGITSHQESQAAGQQLAAGTGFPGFPHVGDIVWQKRRVAQGSPSRCQTLRLWLVSDDTLASQGMFRTFTAVHLGSGAPAAAAGSGLAPCDEKPLRLEARLTLQKENWVASTGSLRTLGDWTAEGPMPRAQGERMLSQLHPPLAEEVERKLRACLLS